MSLFRIFSKAGRRTAGQDGQKYDLPLTSKSLQELFADCSDFSCREIYAGGESGSAVWVAYIDGLVEGSEISSNILRPLTEAQRLSGLKNGRELYDLILHGGVYSYAATEAQTLDTASECLVGGFCVIVFDSLKKAVAFETRSSVHRSVSAPQVEKSDKGSKDSFIESLRINTMLVRRKLRDPDLKIKQTVVGKRSGTTVAIIYLKSIANDSFVEQITQRVEKIDIDGLLTTYGLEEYIADEPRSPFPQTLHTERPDKFCLNLLEGRVGVIVDGLPVGFIFPTTFSQLMKLPEDKSQHFIVATFLIVLRYMALLIAILLPAVYVAIAMYHQEMLPTELLASIIDSKQKVPFPSASEVIGMLVAFELLQEAGLRLPAPVGQTVSIIGALIVGQSAVEAQVVSPIAVIVVALAGLALYTMPSQDLSSAVRVCRFSLVFAAVLFGMFGILMSCVIIVYHLCSLESFGVSYMSPLADSVESGGHWFSQIFLRMPLWKSKQRDPALHTKDERNQR